MLEYIVAFGIGAGVAVAGLSLKVIGAVQYFKIRKLEKENAKVCEESKRAYDKLITTLDNEENMSKLVACFDKSDYRREISRLVTCLNNYLDLRIHAED